MQPSSSRSGSEPPPERPGRLVVALVRGIHGLQGAVRLEVLTDQPARFEPGSVLHREGASEPLTVSWRVDDPPGMLVRFAEIRTRSAAESLRDAYLEAEAQGTLPPGAYYWHEIEGAVVRTTDGETLGQVSDVFRAGETEVYVVRGERRGELLVPAVASVIRDFAPREGRIEVDAAALGLEEVRPCRPRGRRSSRTPRSGNDQP